MKVTVTFHPIPKNRRILGEMFDDMKKSGVDIEYGVDLDTVIVESKYQPTTEKILLVHGYRIVGNYIDGAMEKLASKYQLNEMRGLSLSSPAPVMPGPELGRDQDSKPKSRTPRDWEKVTPTKLTRKNALTFVHQKARTARQNRLKVRSRYLRDKIDGQIEAYEEVLRYLRKR